MYHFTQYRKTMIATCLVLAIPFTIQAEPSKAETGLGNDGKFSESTHDGCYSNHPSFDKKHHFEAPLGFGLGLPIPPHLRNLALTDTQQDKIFNLFYPLIPKIREASKQRHALMEDLHKIGNSETLDEKRLKDTTEKLLALEKESIVNRILVENKIYAMLTPEQRAKLAENEAELQNGFKEFSPEPAVFKMHRSKDSQKMNM